MKKKEIKRLLSEQFESWCGEKPNTITALPQSGSDRQYFRLQNKNRQAIGVFNEDFKENLAFITFSKHFLAKNINVPEILAQNLKKHVYLQSDLGDSNLFSKLLESRKQGAHFTETSVNLYKKALRQLVDLQIKGGENLDFSVCYPRAAFDEQSMMWDLNYFKYNFLKLAKIPFDEQLLEHDFQLLSHFLLKAKQDYFLYRDFQSRNIMVQDEKVYFIDYQGGRKGALHYDLASFLYDAKADIPTEIRKNLLNYYIEELSKYLPVKRKEFLSFYYGYVIIRVLQAMGAYGYRGLFEGKKHFLQSIPYAVQNLKWILKKVELPVKLPYLWQVLKRITEKNWKPILGTPLLKVEINSFSYKRGLPIDKSGNGGGFVFDCRALPNPGRLQAYKQLSGLDKKVIDFLKEKKEVSDFQQLSFKIIENSVKNYIEREFENLSVNFGCTGGQHRSVYNAESLASFLKKKFDIEIVVNHLEKNNWASKKHK